MRRRVLLLALAALPACTTATTERPAASNWVATWAASPTDAGPRPPLGSDDTALRLFDQTLRLIVRTSIGGDAVRIRISNEYGDAPLAIDAAHIAVRDTGASIDVATDRTLTFGGRTAVVLLPRTTALSDPIALAVPASRDLAVSLHVADSARIRTRHEVALQTNYVGKGNVAGARSLVADTTLEIWPLLVGVDVTNQAATGVIVAIGNSITDGVGSTRDANARWPNFLAVRLVGSGEPLKAVVNAGIFGNRVLTFGEGPSALARFDRDVLATPGLTHVILLEGINDIDRSAEDGVTANDIISGCRQLITRAHERGIVIFGATLTPVASFPAALEAKRAAVNAFIRTSGEFDGVIDFDAATRDPANPLQLLPTYDSGDRLHPSDAGYRAMADAIDLTLFRRSR